MKKALKILLCCLVLTFIFLLGGIKIMAKSGINEIYHIVVTPGVDTTKEMTINYHSDVSGSKVYLAKAIDGNFDNALVLEPNEELWSTEDYPKTSTTSKFYTKRYVCNLELKDLEPKTKYVFKIKLGDNFTKEYTFSTAGLTNSFTFLAFTDFQNPNNTQTHTLITKLREYANYPNLVICSGDMVGTAGLEEDFTWLIDNDAFSNFVYASSPGDHEYWADDTGSPYPMYASPYTYNHLFDFPKNGAESSLNSNYYFYYNNILFVSLDMSDSNTSTGSKFTDQINWFKTEIAKLDGTYQYLIVFDHKSIYGAYNEDSSVAKKIRPEWYPVFDEFNVDLVLSGHDHMYSRTYRLYNNQVSTNSKVGTYYLDMGSSGNKRRDTDQQMATDGLHECLLPLKADSLTLGAVISVTENGINVKVMDLDLNVKDQFSITAKRSALPIELKELSNDELLEMVSIKSLGDGNGELIINETDNTKYLKNIKVLLGRKELTSADLTGSIKDKYSFKDNTKYNLTVVFTYNNDLEVELPYTLDIGEITNFSYECNDKLGVKFTNNLDSTFDYYFYLYQNDELLNKIDSTSMTLPIEVNSDSAFIDCTYKIDVYDSKQKNILKSFNFNIPKETINLNEDIIITVNKTYELILDDSIYNNLLTFKIDNETIAKIENNIITGIVSGETKLLVLANDVVIKEIKIIVNEDLELKNLKENKINDLNNKFDNIDKTKYEESSVTTLLNELNNTIEKINNAKTLDEVNNLYNDILPKFDSLSLKEINEIPQEPVSPKSGCGNSLISLFTMFGALIILVLKRKSFN